MQEEFGAYLKAQRELRGVSLKEISSETKIPLRHLDALEGNEQDELPDEVFVKGYIKAYADSIGADVDEILTAYDETVIAPIREEAEQKRIIEEDSSRRKKNIFVGVLSLVIITGMAAGYWFISQEPKSSQPKKVITNKNIEKAAVKEDKVSVEVVAQQDVEKLEEEPEENGESESIVEDKPDKPKDEPNIDEAASKPAETKKNVSEKKSNNNTAETGNKTSEKKREGLASIASKNNVKENRVSNTENSVTIQAHKNNEAEKKSEPLHLVVKAEQEGWFNLIVDGSQRKDFILPAGTSKSFRAENSINVWIGNRQGTKLILNDKALKLPESVDNVIRNFLVTSKLLE
jgi:cytoskeletal protein RodZ